ncbi:MAG: hypothetical protein P1R58_02500 [bacterium]|nr:hypothetical protein [bacterium]
MSNESMSKLPRQTVVANETSYTSPGGDAATGAVATKDIDPTHSFEQLARRLSDQHQVNRGVMVIRNDSSNDLGVVSVWDESGIKSGLTLTLPSENSLFHQVVRDGRRYTLGNLNNFSGNFFERKLLLEEATSSMLLIPLTSREQVVGLIGFSSVRNKSLQEIVGEELLAETSALAGLIESKID